MDKILDEGEVQSVKLSSRLFQGKCVVRYQCRSVLVCVKISSKIRGSGERRVPLFCRIGLREMAQAGGRALGRSGLANQTGLSYLCAGTGWRAAKSAPPSRAKAKWVSSTKGGPSQPPAPAACSAGRFTFVAFWSAQPPGHSTEGPNCMQGRMQGRVEWPMCMRRARADHRSQGCLNHPGDAGRQLQPANFCWLCGKAVAVQPAWPRPAVCLLSVYCLSELLGRNSIRLFPRLFWNALSCMNYSIVRGMIIANSPPM
jgi:hypothetical protein